MIEIFFINIINLFIIAKNWIIFKEVFFEYITYYMFINISKIILIIIFLFAALYFIGRKIFILCLFLTVILFFNHIFEKMESNYEIIISFYFILCFLTIVFNQLIINDAILIEFVKKIMQLYFKKILYYNLIYIPFLLFIYIMFLINITLYRISICIGHIYCILLIYIFSFTIYLLNVFIATDIIYNTEITINLFLICLKNVKRTVKRALFYTFISYMLIILKIIFTLLKLSINYFLSNQYHYFYENVNYSFIFVAFFDIQYEKIFEMTYNILISNYFFISENFYFFDRAGVFINILVLLIILDKKLYDTLIILFLLYVNLNIIQSIKNILIVLYLYNKRLFKNKHKNIYMLINRL